jgi:hypothetical protein
MSALKACDPSHLPAAQAAAPAEFCRRCMVGGALPQLRQPKAGRGSGSCVHCIASTIFSIYFVIPLLNYLLDVTTGTDFGPLYTKMEQLPDIPSSG